MAAVAPTRDDAHSKEDWRCRSRTAFRIVSHGVGEAARKADLACPHCKREPPSVSRCGGWSVSPVRPGVLVNLQVRHDLEAGKDLLPAAYRGADGDERGGS